MIRHLAVLLAAVALSPGLSAQVDLARHPESRSALRPDTVLAPSGGPRVVILSARGEGVAALRLAVPLRESGLEGGAGWLLKELGLERMRTLARPVGADVAASRTPWGIAYSVVGAAADLEYLAYLLREAVAPPDVDAPSFHDTLRRLMQVSARSLETPRGRITADLRAGLGPGTPPVAGTPGSVAFLDGARVREVWLRSHQADAMTLVVSAPVIPEVVLAATRGMGAPEASAAGPADAPLPVEPRRARPQSLRTWYGEAWQGGTGEDPHGAVAALLVTRSMRERADGFEAAVELWELPDRWALAVVGAGYGPAGAAMRRAVSSVLAATRDALEATAVRDAVSQVLGDLLVRARTPAGLVSLVGRAMEAGGDPNAAERHVEALRRVDVASTRGFLEELLARAPVQAEVRP